MKNLSSIVADFMHGVASGRIEIYNEFSLQHELGIFLREQWPAYKIQFERNVSHFSSGVTKKSFTKREIDIVATHPDHTDLQCAIELKFPRRGQYPEQMFSFCKDIAFAEELHAIGFTQTAFIAVADDPLFYSGASEGIYAFFRGARPLSGQVHKPTGAKNDSVTIKGTYRIDWQNIAGSMRYALVTVGNCP